MMLRSPLQRAYARLGPRYPRAALGLAFLLVHHDQRLERLLDRHREEGADERSEDGEHEPHDDRQVQPPLLAVHERPPGGYTVLVVDDEEAVRRLACRMLTWTGYQALEATHGREAIATIEQHAAHHGVIEESLAVLI